MMRGTALALSLDKFTGVNMADLNCKLDWLSWTFPITRLPETDTEFTVNHILTAFHEASNHGLLSDVSARLWSFEPVSGFYTRRIKDPKTGLTISWTGGNPYAQAVCSGMVCDVLLQHMTPEMLCACTAGRCTRIDLAIDIETDVPPSEFARMREAGRIETYSRMVSPTGETCYVGSRKSDRMARVYRYNPPHPRSHLLRVEGEFKGDAAKQVVTHLCRDGLTKTCAAAHAAFGWEHPLYTENAMIVSAIPARVYDRVGAERLKWLNEVCAAAIRKASFEGLIDLDDWIQTHLKPTE